MTSEDVFGLNSKEIGCTKGSMQEYYLKKWNTTQGNICRVKTYDGNEELYEAFDTYKLEAVVDTDNAILPTDGMAPLVKVGTSEYFLAVSKKRQNLLGELNQILAKINTVSPYYLQNLHNKYFSETVVNKTLSSSEQHWLDHHDTLHIGYLNDYLPYCGTDDTGEVTGIVKDIVEHMLLGLSLQEKLQVTYKGYESHEALFQALRQEDIDMIFPIYSDIWFSEKNHVYQTSDVITSTMNLIFKGEFSEQSTSKIAVNKNNWIQYENHNDTYTIEMFMRDHVLVFLGILSLFIALISAIAIICIMAARRQKRYANTLRDNQEALEVALRAAEDGNRAKTTFLNNMSHDIRTPMNAIIGFTSLAATHTDNKEMVEDYLKKIMTSSNHLLSLINDVLDMGRIESGKVKIEEKECHLPTIMHDLRSILQADVNAKRLKFFIDTVDVLDENIYCDKLRVNQVLLNCMSNAIKFTRPGGTVGIRIVQKQGAPNGYANFEFIVQDTGIGMSEDYLKHIFEPFTREESSTVSGIQGTGLGMSITKNIVDMMGGTITVKSKKYEGTEFHIALCFRLNRNPTKISVIKEFEGLKALVVDDSMDTCISVSKMLETIGMNPEWTMSGVEAVNKARYAYERGKPYRAFIIDWLMPDMNGVEVVRRIRSRIGEDTPIIILTAYDWSEIEKEARAAGVTSFCAKPLFLSDLYETLNNALSKAKREEEVEIKKEASPKASYRGHILIVEDNDLNREISRAILEDSHVSIEEAENGQVAVDMIKTSKEGYYSLVLMDIQMPVMDGYEAAKTIRELNRSDVKTLPIIAVSANAFEEDIQKSLEVGMNEHISKTINKTRMEELINCYIPRT